MHPSWQSNTCKTIWNNAVTLWTRNSDVCMCQRGAVLYGFVHPEEDSYIKCLKGRETIHQCFSDICLSLMTCSIHLSGLGKEAEMSYILLLVPWWYLLAVTLLQTKHKWEKANLLMKALDCSWGLGVISVCFWFLSWCLDLPAGVKIKQVVRTCFSSPWCCAPIFFLHGSQGVLDLDLALICS